MADNDESYEVLNCSEFYPKFLDPISEDVRRDLIHVIHQLNQLGSSGEDAREKCEEIMLNVEKELGVNNFICEAVAKELSECLRKLCLLTDCVDFLNNRLSRIRARDFGCLMILANVYELSGDYRNALKLREETLQLAKMNGDPILTSLVLVKQACDLWHLHRPEEAKENVSSSLAVLEDSSVPSIVDTFPFSESTHRLIDLYKTLGYIHRFLGDRSNSAKYYIKALDIVQQDEDAHVHIFKLETQIGCEYSSSKFGFKSEAQKFSMNAYHKMKTVLDKETFMLHHCLTVVHAMSRILHSLQQIKATSGVLPIREELYAIAEKYLGDNNPDVARIAADTALFCNTINDREKASEYLGKAEAALESNASNADLEFLKLHVREIGDAWKSIGLLYSNRRDFVQAEKSFLKAVQVNTRVYGLQHPRQARLYRSFGLLYRKFGKYSDAVPWLKKCMDVNDEFSPNDTKLRQQVNREIHMCKNKMRSSWE